MSETGNSEPWKGTPEMDHNTQKDASARNDCSRSRRFEGGKKSEEYAKSRQRRFAEAMWSGEYGKAAIAQLDR